MIPDLVGNESVELFTYCYTLNPVAKVHLERRQLSNTAEFVRSARLHVQDLSFEVWRLRMARSACIHYCDSVMRLNFHTQNADRNAKAMQ